MNIIGLRKEEKMFETRVPVVPEHIKLLSTKHGIQFAVEPSNQRAFGPDEFEKVGAQIKPLKGTEVSVILGVKEMPNDFYEKGKTYVFFSHTIKGQKYNMPMLKKIMNVGATLIDYERIVNEKGFRLIFFGNWAGLAGMSETFRILGLRLEVEGIKPNPFSGMKHTAQYKDLNGLKKGIQALGKRIKEQGLPDSLTPFIVGFAGYGNVSRGAQEIFDILPYETIEPKNLANVTAKRDLLYKCVFKEEHMVKPLNSSAKFELMDYYEHGATKYKGKFESYIPHLTVLINCIYWTKKSPRLVTKNFIRKHWNNSNRRLRIVGDISCDVNGAMEFTLQCTDAGEPAFTYLVDEDRAVLGVEGNGPVVMAVDNLPTELPRESSTSFSETLLDFIPALAKADFTVPFSQLTLPRELKDATIVYNGELTKNYEYLKNHLLTKEN
jgi:alpha-aminoadipic semialdehyde synthase